MPDSRSATPHLRRDLRRMTGDGLAFSLMVGVGEFYVAPFAFALGFGDVVAGLVATLPMLVGAVLQLVTPAAVGWLGSHKRWVVLCAGLQAATFVPLATGALAGELEPGLLYLAVSLYWGLGMATSPAWNTWAGTLVPKPLRAGYFASRARWSQAALLAGLILGAALLELAERTGAGLEGYAWAFGCALAARLVSTWFLSRQTEQRPVRLGELRLAPRALRRHLREGGRGRLLAYLLVFQASVWIAAPYFTPYMLGPLGLDYSAFALLTGVSFVARIAALPALGRLVRRWGTHRVLRLGSLWIVPLPLLWLVSDSFTYLLVLQLLAGAAWAAFELATLLAFFEHLPEHTRTSVLSLYNLAYAVAIAAGSALGGWLLSSAGGDAAAYVLLLGVSTLARFASLSLLGRVGDVVPASTRPPPLRTLGLRPSAGAVQRPVLAALPDAEEPARGCAPRVEPQP